MTSATAALSEARRHDAGRRRPRPSALGMRGVLGRFALRTLAAWIVLGVRYTLLFVLVPGTAWSEGRLPDFIRLALLAQGALAVGLRAVVIGAVLSLVDDFVDDRGRRRLSPWARLGAIGTLVVIEGLMLASWAAFYTLGQFLDRDSSSFFFSNARLVLAHARDMAPWTLVAVPAAAAVLVWLCHLLGRAFCALGPAPRRSLLGVGTLGAVLVAGLAWFGDPTDVPGLPQATQIALARLVNDRTAPMLHLAADVFGDARTERIAPPGTETSAALTLTRRPIVPLESYADAAVHAGAGRRRLNVLLVIVESLRPDQLRAFGGPRTVMPTVDSIARASTIYAASETQATHTDLAVPSILSSQYPLRDWIEAPYPTRPAYPRVLIYDALHAAGYHTGVFSSQNEAWGGMANFILTDGIDHFLDAEHYRGPTYVPRGDRGFALWVRGERRAGKIDDRFTAAEAVAWLDSVPRDRPFFAYLNLQSSHTPYERPTDFAPRFGSGTVSFPITFAGFPADSAAAVRDVYANSLAYADAQIASVVHALQKSGRWDSTVVVVLGDHGEAFYEHGVAAHGNSLFQDVTHVPLVVHVPGEAPRVDTLPAAAIDVPPTVLGALGLPPHPAFQGTNLRDPTVDRAGRPLFLLTQTPMLHAAGVVQHGLKLMVDTRTGERALFDLRADPLERHPLDPQLSPEGRAMTATLASWWGAQLAYYASPAALSRWYAPFAAATPAGEGEGAYAARAPVAAGSGKR
ncbi:MAG TPA: sulfatase [Gemmatimonadaceae bacterium]|nr:sulfatase [Gemmatimonadaceae bacterium]